MVAEEDLAEEEVLKDLVAEEAMVNLAEEQGFQWLLRLLKEVTGHYQSLHWAYSC